MRELLLSDCFDKKNLTSILSQNRIRLFDSKRNKNGFWSLEKKLFFEIPENLFDFFFLKSKVIIYTVFLFCRQMSNWQEVCAISFWNTKREFHFENTWFEFEIAEKKSFSILFVNFKKKKKKRIVTFVRADTKLFLILWKKNAIWNTFRSVLET